MGLVLDDLLKSLFLGLVEGKLFLHVMDLKGVLLGIGSKKLQVALEFLDGILSFLVLILIDLAYFKFLLELTDGFLKFDSIFVVDLEFIFEVVHDDGQLD